MNLFVAVKGTKYPVLLLVGRRFGVPKGMDFFLIFSVIRLFGSEILIPDCRVRLPFAQLVSRNVEL